MMVHAYGSTYGYEVVVPPLSDKQLSVVGRVGVARDQKSLEENGQEGTVMVVDKSTKEPPAGD